MKKDLQKLERTAVLALWHKRLMWSWKRISRLYAPPEPLPHTAGYWLAFSLVCGAVILFSTFFIVYLTDRHMAFTTNAEDLGIMDQALWNTLHGQVLHQTICNIISDTNCAGPGGLMRFAIHFEPTLFPLALLYLFWPDPRTLLIVQVIVVASGAFPAFWLARLRLRNEIAAVLIAFLYLLYPSQQQATVFDFHAVTLTTSLLLFALYFMYTRRTIPLFICVLLAMGCKEQIPLIIIMLGAWMLLFQQRWQVGLLFIISGALWFWLAVYVIMPQFSPTGQPLLMSRYQDVGTHPTDILGTMLRDPKAFFIQHFLNGGHRAYLRILLSPLVYIPLLAPWVLVLATPSLTINMISSNEQMYSGLFQYNAEIVPIIIFATIEGLICLQWLARRVIGTRIPHRVQIQLTRNAQQKTLWDLPATRLIQASLVIFVLSLAFINTARYDRRFHGQMPFSRDFTWPLINGHTRLAEDFIHEIPADAVVSAQSRLVPHISHREKIYLFPYGSDQAEYVFLDVTSDVYPYFGVKAYRQAVIQLLAQGQYGILDARDGYLLLKRNLPPPSLAFCPTVTEQVRHQQGSELARLLDQVCASTPQTTQPQTG